MKFFSPFLLLFFTFFISENAVAGNRDSLDALYFKKSRWSIEVAAGYGIPLGRQVLGMKSTIDTDEVYTTQNLTGTYGEGFWGFANAVYMMRPHFGFFGGAYYFKGNETTSDYYSDQKPGVSILQFTKTSIVSQGPVIGFIFSDTLRKRFTITNQSGFMFGIGNKASIHWHAEDSFGANVSDKRNEEFGGYSYGWVNRAGISFMTRNQWTFGIEGFVVLHSWGPEKGKMNSYVQNGQDMMNTIPASEREYLLVNFISYNPRGPLPAGRYLRLVYPMHSAGLLLHVTYSLKTKPRMNRK